MRYARPFRPGKTAKPQNFPGPLETYSAGMGQHFITGLAFLTLLGLGSAGAQMATANAPQPSTAPVVDDAAPLPETRGLLLEVERNDKRLQALRQDYTYHVHAQEQEFKKDGSVKKQVVTDSESLTISGIRVNRVVARNGQPLTPEEQAKESERVDKEVAKGRERQAKAVSKGEVTDDRGDEVLSAARILELGTFSNERRTSLNGRPTILLDYAGDPNAKTHSAVENIMRDLVGTVWIDEQDRVLVRGEGHFLNDFKIGGGLVADVHKGTSFAFQATRVNDSVWLPATIHGQGSIRLMLFVGFDGRVNLETSDYRRFRTSATILPGESKVDANGDRVPPAAAGSTPATDTPANGSSQPQ